MAQWLRIPLAMQGTPVRFLVREDPTCLRATKSVRATTTEACVPYSPCCATRQVTSKRARVLQLETQHSQKENKYTGHLTIKAVSLVAQSVKNLPAKQETACNARDLSSIPGLGRSLKKEMANHSSIPA